MAAFISFLFCRDNIIFLTQLWNTYLDEQYVRDNVLIPLLQHVPNGILLVRSLLQVARNGVQIKKSDKAQTSMIFITKVIAPFLLTIPSERPIPLPEVVFLRTTKARAVPKSQYGPSIDRASIDMKKIASRERSTVIHAF